jgi:hypothetical protein
MLIDGKMVKVERYFPNPGNCANKYQSYRDILRELVDKLSEREKEHIINRIRCKIISDSTDIYVLIDNMNHVECQQTVYYIRRNQYKRVYEQPQVPLIEPSIRNELIHNELIPPSEQLSEQLIKPNLIQYGVSTLLDFDSIDASVKIIPAYPIIQTYNTSKKLN